MASKYAKDFVVPTDFRSVLKSFTREALRSQPENVYEFGAEYFANLLAQMKASAEVPSNEQLTPEQMQAKLHALFREADTDKSNSLSILEFKVRALAVAVAWLLPASMYAMHVVPPA